MFVTLDVEDPARNISEMHKVIKIWKVGRRK